MKIRKSELGDEAARAAYRARYRQRGAARAPKSRISDHGAWPEDDPAYGSKPNHAARAIVLPLVSRGAPRRPVQKEHPKREPLTTEARMLNYRRQTGRHRFTDRQWRRITKKRWR